MYAVIVLCVVCVATFLAYRFAMRLNWPQRKLMLYLMVLAPFVGVAVKNKELGEAIVIIGFAMALPSIFAVLLAPDKAEDA